MLLTICNVHAQEEGPALVPSKDGTPISYEVHGSGSPTLVFVHGWSCDARYWRNQVAFFSQDHQVVLPDLAGHGHSGVTRRVYSMEAFGEDVQAVCEKIGSRDIILIGHSMGGAVIAEAARLMPQRVKGLIGIDTYENVEYPLSRDQLEQMIAPLQTDFQAGTRQFVQGMFYPHTDSLIRTWVIADMSAAPPDIGLSAMEELMSRNITGQAARSFDEIHIPVMAVNGDLWPIDFEANRRHMHSFETIILEGADHFLMLNRPDEFNKALKQAIKTVYEQIL